MKTTDGGTRAETTKESETKIERMKTRGHLLWDAAPCRWTAVVPNANEGGSPVVWYFD